MNDLHTFEDYSSGRAEDVLLESQSARDAAKAALDAAHRQITRTREIIAGSCESGAVADHARVEAGRLAADQLHATRSPCATSSPGH